MELSLYIFLLVFYFTASDGRQFRADYTYDQTAEGWFKLHVIPATWQDARFRCHHEGAVLASPENMQMLDAMENILNNTKTTCGIFTGIHATYSKGDYHTIQGTPLRKFQHLLTWAPDEPDNFENGEDCLIMLPNGSMADAPCSHVLPYICFRKKTTSVVTGCGTVDYNYNLDFRTGSCYKFHRERLTWSRAFAACSGEGGHLAVINSDTEAEVLKDLYAKNRYSVILYKSEHTDSAFIGGTDWNERGLWHTVHGLSLDDAGYNKWDTDQPNNLTRGQFCLSIYRTALLNDLWCDEPNPFICEKSPDSLLEEDDQ